MHFSDTPGRPRHSRPYISRTKPETAPPDPHISPANDRPSPKPRLPQTRRDLPIRISERSSAPETAPHPDAGTNRKQSRSDSAPLRICRDSQRRGMQIQIRTNGKVRTEPIPYFFDAFIHSVFHILYYLRYRKQPHTGSGSPKPGLRPGRECVRIKERCGNRHPGNPHRPAFCMRNAPGRDTKPDDAPASTKKDPQLPAPNLRKRNRTIQKQR